MYKISTTNKGIEVNYLGNFGSSQLTEAMPFALFPKMSPGMKSFVEEQKETTAYGEGEGGR